MRDEAARELRELNEVVERLRAPGGCPWDREQTHESLRPHLLEETYEVLDAIDEHSDDLREELGDLLLQVLMQSSIAMESPEGFDIGDVARTTKEKMIHRHPHVFGDAVVSGTEEVLSNWEQLKRTEKSDRVSILDGVPAGLPALAYAQTLQRKPARAGLDVYPSAEAAWEQARGLLGALGPAAREADRVKDGGWGSSDESGTPPVPGDKEAEDRMGELLFALAGFARLLRVNPEDALRARASRFRDRFKDFERRARADGVDIHALSPEEWRERWQSM